MATDIRVMGACITLDDLTSPLTPDSSIGLYNQVSLLTTTNYVIGGDCIYVADIGLFSVGDKIYIYDDNHSEYNSIDAIQVESDYIHLTSVLSHDYYLAANASVRKASVLKWISNTIPGVDWATGMIVKGGVGAWKRSVDCKKGGAMAAASSGSVTVKNTAQFYKTLVAKSINLVGLVCQIYEFVGTEAQVRYYGLIDSCEWDATNYIINLRGGINDRNANITTQGKTTGSNPTDYTMPVHFGELKPEISDAGIFLADVYLFNKIWRDGND